MALLECGNLCHVRLVISEPPGKALMAVYDGKQVAWHGDNEAQLHGIRPTCSQLKKKIKAVLLNLSSTARVLSKWPVKYAINI